MIVRFSPRPEDLQRLQVGPIGPHFVIRSEIVCCLKNHASASQKRSFVER